MIASRDAIAVDAILHYMSKLTEHKFKKFEQFLASLSNNWVVQQALKQSSIDDIRYIFKKHTYGELKRCQEIAEDYGQDELCSNLKALIKERDLFME